LAKAKQAETVAESSSLLSRVERLMARCEDAYERAQKAGQWSGAAAFAREIRGSLQLLGQLSGELRSGARVAVNFATVIQSLDVSALTGEQIEAVYDKIQANGLREISELSDAEIEAQIRQICGVSGIVFRKATLVDETTIPPPSNIETWRRSDESLNEVNRSAGMPVDASWKPHRSAHIQDRYRLLLAAWERLTGQSLEGSLSAGELGTNPTIAIDFDLADDRYQWWDVWPTVRLIVNSADVPETSLPALPQVIEGE
jgi:hypothetical protein